MRKQALRLSRRRHASRRERPPQKAARLRRAPARPPSSTRPAQAAESGSVGHKALETAVYNGKDQKIDDIDDVILAQSGKAAGFA